MEVTATGLMPFGPTLLPTPDNPITAIPLAEGLMTNGDFFVEQLDSFNSSSPRINFLDELMVGSAVSLLAPHRRLIKDALIRPHVTDASVNHPAAAGMHSHRHDQWAFCCGASKITS